MDAATMRHTAAVGQWVAGLTWDAVPTAVRARLRLVLLDVLGITMVGARDPEQRRLVQAWDPSPGPAPVFGSGVSTAVETAAWLNATALVRLELDEGNKFAKGHPAAHGFPAVLALAAARDADAETLLPALLAAYEVASRFGRATTLRPGMHPHGSWGVTGAAAGCSRLLGLDGEATAAAVDTAAGLPVAAHFSSALDGNRVRDAWVGASNASGLNAARMAAAGLATNTGTAAYTLGDLLGTFDPVEASSQLGSRWDIELGYFKQHAACSFTHPAADAALELRATGGLPAAEAIDRITVETHALAVGLDRQSWDNRLSAMFSIPFVVAAAVVHGSVGPEVTEGVALEDPVVRSLARRVHVRGAEDLDARLPQERPVRLSVVSGERTWAALRPGPIGDSSFHPLDEDDVRDLVARLLGSRQAADAVVGAVDRLFAGQLGAGAVLGALTDPVPPQPRIPPLPVTSS
ncbi:MAG TPA: MmgE/PrpD family protein [Intrasporangium sp.]|uniref:MmgE/PrpD family protein n=1 Tax=Intrasporangium sp. TaxID=1925024 RepID=UPI002D782E57|nr:MmgE/PrpD family protein [Intrasporangium sp.]HET7400100.1 MmgE/PrpD family protein [Intrasporangium sp.]